ncbi:MAG: type 4a pilus biogenesis protein PilO [Deltaproteobacteria bacterium]|nr:type 4a pilus biogenesis protein PilO [Deltaproteobacteria bacterium]MBW2643322.1 type 4a pilus biogenesis protein PilO [Deltaproteobacteria bacterium]
MKKIEISKFTELLLEKIDKIGKLSRLYRILICLGIFSMLIGPFVYFSYQPKVKKIDELKQEQETLKTRLVRAKAKARQLKHFQDKLKKAQTEFKIAVKKLPEKKEIPSLLLSISRSGRDAGLEFLLFEPRDERTKEFYAEIPVSIIVTGNYHKTALFFDKVARLHRIVNIDDIKMIATKGSGDLRTSCTAVTYRFVETKPNKASKKRK